MAKSLFLNNLLLTLIWVLATGTLTEENLLFGFFLGFTILWIITTNKRESKYFYIVPTLISFLLTMLWEIIKANFMTVKESIFQDDLEPAIIKYPLQAKTDGEISLLANIISLTPGTVVIDVSDDKKVMFIHVMHLKDKKSFIEEIQIKFENKLLRIIR
ncbi:Na+/H+ antiporter subunit E [Mongoliitalea daihaiensis]|uniref:Na+/H+ antiporter subunit E n=1 Tax=Mongoliitalea daihaiensis TaxID=2782006 RepID=UPI001F2EB245|nr:Na+/H+ antiporter subunit E [Mongoliitalea daihaiensis]UJP64065.1 Na+/H+ antiporter subunit E [Mongoliitalea daihaiensis]